MIQKVNLQEKFAQFNDHWSPKIAGALDNFHIKLVKLQGEFVWHHHHEEDELFLVVAGQLIVQIRDQPDLVLEAGEFVIIPKGIEHCPKAPAECQVLLFERQGTVNTGSSAGSSFTKTELQEI